MSRKNLPSLSPPKTPKENVSLILDVPLLRAALLHLRSAISHRVSIIIIGRKIDGKTTESVRRESRAREREKGGESWVSREESG